MESPYKEILLFITGGGFITAVIALSKEIRERVAAKKAEKKAQADAHLSQSIEMQRLENESDEALWVRLNEENRRLNEELRGLRETSSLSFTTKSNWYKCHRELGVKIDKHETQVIREMPLQSLLISLEDLKKKYDELGEKMP